MSQVTFQNFYIQIRHILKTTASLSAHSHFTKLYSFYSLMQRVRGESLDVGSGWGKGSKQWLKNCPSMPVNLQSVAQVSTFQMPVSPLITYIHEAKRRHGSHSPQSHFQMLLIFHPWLTLSDGETRPSARACSHSGISGKLSLPPWLLEKPLEESSPDGARTEPHFEVFLFPIKNRFQSKEYMDIAKNGNTKNIPITQECQA